MYDDILGYEYGIYRDNMYIILNYYQEDKELYFHIYAGNVVKERQVTKENVKTLLENSSLLEENYLDDDYYIIEIQNDSVLQAGYYEFLIFSTDRFMNDSNEEQPCYYLLTDGKNINLFSNEIVNIELPTNVNIVEREEEIVLVTTSAEIVGGEGENGYGAVVRQYILENNVFTFHEKTIIGKYAHKNEWAILKVVDGKEEIINLMKTANLDLVAKNGRKVYWLKNVE